MGESQRHCDDPKIPDTEDDILADYIYMIFWKR